VIAAIILKVNPLLFIHKFSATCVPKLAGASEEEIANDYALSRVGREPLRERSLLRLSMEPLFASNQEAALNMFSCRWVFGWLLVHYIRTNSDQTRPETISTFLKMLEEQYGGTREYIKQHTELTDNDITTIRDNLLYLQA
jgi:protein tyrosine/serine phosphatase